MLVPGYRRATGALRLENFMGRKDILSMLLLAAPVVLGVAATNINVLVNTFAASYAEDGAIAWLNYGYRIMHLPLGLIAVSLGSAALPALSRAFASGDKEQFRVTIGEALSHSIRLSIPATLGLVLLRDDIVDVLYGYGRFTADDVRHTGLALAAYCVGIPAFSFNRILAPAFYARKDTRTPVRIGMVSVLTNMAGNAAALYLGYGYLGIALAASVAGCVQMSLLLVTLRRKAGRIGGRIMARALAWTVLVCALMAGSMLMAKEAGIENLYARLAAEIASGCAIYGVALGISKRMRI